MSSLLLNEYPLIVLPSLAVKLGLNEAILLQQLHYWLQKTDFIKNNKKWVYYTYEDIHKQLPFLSIRTLKRIVKSLKDNNILLVEKFNKKVGMQINYYSINYKKLESLNYEKIHKQGMGQNDTKGCQNDTIYECQNDTCSSAKMTLSTYTETTKTENTYIDKSSDVFFNSQKQFNYFKDDEVNKLMNEYLKFRKFKKLSNSDIVIKRLINKLKDFYNKGYKPQDIIMNALTNGWKDFYEPKLNNNIRDDEAFIRSAKKHIDDFVKGDF